MSSSDSRGSFHWTGEIGSLKALNLELGVEDFILAQNDISRRLNYFTAHVQAGKRQRRSSERLSIYETELRARANSFLDFLLSTITELKLCVHGISHQRANPQQDEWLHEPETGEMASAEMASTREGCVSSWEERVIRYCQRGTVGRCEV
jgi:hypothetical protein